MSMETLYMEQAVNELGVSTLHLWFYLVKVQTHCFYYAVMYFTNLKLTLYFDMSLLKAGGVYVYML